MKNLTKTIITTSFLLWAFAPVTLANPIWFDDPQFVTLSDGRRVPFGPGVICSDECRDAAALALPDSSTSRRWLWIPVITTVIICAVLCRPGRPPVITTPTPEQKPTPTPTPRREVPPRTEQPPVTPVPEPAALVSLGLGLGLLAIAARKKGTK